VALRFYSDAGRPAELAAPASALPSPAALLPYVDIVIAVTSPWMWVGRRLDQYRNFVASQRRSRFTAKLLFVMGDTMVPAALNEWDQDAIAHPDIEFITARGCPDADSYWPGALDGAMFPPANSSTTCKVLEGAAVAVAKWARQKSRAAAETSAACIAACESSAGTPSSSLLLSLSVLLPLSSL
jgi:hypothetical protein